MKFKFYKNEENLTEDEKLCINKSIDLLNPSGKVLEIGFAYEYSSNLICDNNNVTDYYVVECSPKKWKKFNLWKDNQLKKRSNLNINLIKGRWEDVLDEEGIFDCIYFDIYDDLKNNKDLIDDFFLNTLKKNSKLNTKYCIFNKLSINPFSKVKCLNSNQNSFNFKKANSNNLDKINIFIFERISDNLDDIENEIRKIRNYPPKGQIIVIDNFYNNPMETRNYILTQEFKVRGNYPGQRTKSFATLDLKNIIEKYISQIAGKITDWPMENDNDVVYNGSFQYTTSRDRSWIHNDGVNNWAGVCYLTPDAPVSSGTGFYKFVDGTRNSIEAEERLNVDIINKNSQDLTKWELVDSIGNIFNRIILFNAKNYHMSQDYFGTDRYNGRLFQVFFFSTEY